MHVLPLAQNVLCTPKVHSPRRVHTWCTVSVSRTHKVPSAHRLLRYLLRTSLGVHLRCTKCAEYTRGVLVALGEHSRCSQRETSCVMVTTANVLPPAVEVGIGGRVKSQQLRSSKRQYFEGQSMVETSATRSVSPRHWRQKVHLMGRSPSFASRTTHSKPRR